MFGFNLKVGLLNLLIFVNISCLNSRIYSLRFLISLFNLLTSWFNSSKVISLGGFLNLSKVLLRLNTGLSLFLITLRSLRSLVSLVNK